MPTRVCIAPGCAEQLPDVALSLETESLLLVVDSGLRETPWPERLLKGLHQAGVRTYVFDRVEANPRTSTAERIADLIRQEEMRGVVGLGGGSVLDAAKAGAMLATNEGRAATYAGKDRYSNAPLPFVAVPTTCGTGSEVTWVSVLSDEEARTKISVKGESMFPNQALVDADLLRTLPARLVAWTGLDALTHALEATTGRLANPVSDALAEKAIALLFEYLPRAAADIDGDGDARREVMRASTLAGLAFGNADVAAVHCLSEALGGLYDVPHGLANAVLLAPIMRSHCPRIESRLEALAPLVGARGSEGFLDHLEALVAGLETPPFSHFQIPAGDYPDIAERATANGSNSSNPRPMGAAEYLRILVSL